jgi:hypothetical protein
LDILQAILDLFSVSALAERPKQDYPAITYEQASRPNVEPWQWRIPDRDLNLTLHDEIDRSTIYLPHHLSFIEGFIVAIGYGTIGLGAFIAIHLLISSLNLVGAILSFGIIGGAGWYLLSAGSRVIRLELKDGSLTLVNRFGFRLARKRCYRHDPNLKFRGDLQNFLTMDRTQTSPNYNISIKYGKHGKKKTFITACNQTQGSWLVSGLEAWRDRTRLE